MGQHKLQTKHCRQKKVFAHIYEQLSIVETK